MAEPVRETGVAAAAPAGNWRWALLCALLLAGCIASAFGVIYSAHRARELFRELEALRQDENGIQIEWRQLLLERSTLSSHARVEAIATSELQMKPVEGEIRTVRLK